MVYHLWLLGQTVYNVDFMGALTSSPYNPIISRSPVGMDFQTIRPKENVPLLPTGPHVAARIAEAEIQPLRYCECPRQLQLDHVIVELSDRS